MNQIHEIVRERRTRVRFRLGSRLSARTVGQFIASEIKQLEKDAHSPIELGFESQVS